jgi:hypothetical protein
MFVQTFVERPMDDDVGIRCRPAVNGEPTE